MSPLSFRTVLWSSMAWWSVSFLWSLYRYTWFGAIRPTFWMMTWRLLTWTQISKGFQVYFLKLKVPSSNTSSRADPSLGYNAWKRSKMESTLGAAEHCTWPWCRGSSHLGTFECSQRHDNSSKAFRFYMFGKVQTNKEKLEAKVGSPSLSVQKCLAKSISQEWQQIGQSDHKGSTWGRPRCMLLYAASFFPYDFYQEQCSRKLLCPKYLVRLGACFLGMTV